MLDRSFLGGFYIKASNFLNTNVIFLSRTHSQNFKLTPLRRKLLRNFLNFLSSAYVRNKTFDDDDDDDATLRYSSLLYATLHYFRDCKSETLRMKFFDFGVEFFFGCIKVPMVLQFFMKKPATIW
jgi:hypothetical protein